MAAVPSGTRSGATTSAPPPRDPDHRPRQLAAPRPAPHESADDGTIALGRLPAPPVSAGLVALSPRGAGRVGLPLWLLAAGITMLAGLATLAAVALTLLMADQLSTDAGVGLGMGAGLSIVVAMVAGRGAGRFGQGLHILRTDTMRRLADPPAVPGDGCAATRSRAVSTSSELAELARTLDALHVRVRVADDMADRQRQAAETASAGMFELLTGLVEAEESARGQLSAELHDTVAQSLMVARSLLAAGRRPGAADDDTLARAAEQLQEADDQVRALMARTRPPGLRDGDLAVAVRGLRDDLAHRYGLAVSISWPSAPHPLPLVSAVTVYRFFQEGLLNVVKHADVDAAELHLVVGERELTATVRDRGPGFDPATIHPQAGRHVGLGLLRERARLAGGEVEVETALGQGTALTLRLPAHG